MMRSNRKRVILTLSPGRLDREALARVGFKTDDQEPSYDQGKEKWTWIGTIPADAEEDVLRVKGVEAVHPNSDLELIEH